MSSSYLAQERHGSTIAMVRSFNGRPGKVSVFGHENGVVAVSAGDESLKIGFPEGDVMVFTDQLYQRLVAAYESQDHDKLKSLWNSAQPLFG